MIYKLSQFSQTYVDRMKASYKSISSLRKSQKMEREEKRREF